MEVNVYPIEKNGRAASADAGEMPSAVSGHLSVFDRFASKISSYVSRAWFFRRTQLRTPAQMS